MSTDGGSERRPRSSVFAIRDFRWYLAGVAFSQVGTNGAFAAMLYQVYVLTGSTLQVGVVGVVRGVATIALSPMAGHLADHMDRKLLLQLSQLVSMASGLGLAAVTIAGVAESWHVWTAAVLTSVAATADSPVRKAIVPAMIPRELLMHATAMINPTNQVGKLVGPGLAGVLIAAVGPELMYLFDAASYAVLVVVLITIHIEKLTTTSKGRMWASIWEGVTFVRRRPVIYQLIGLDISASLFTAYRVVLPAIALDRLHVGPTGYGLLGAATPAGALLGGFVAYRLAGSSVRSGHVVLATTAMYGGSAIVLALSGSFGLALVGAAGLGVFDAIGTTIRHAAVMLETPDPLQGRVQALYGMSSRGVPAIGEFNVGWIAALIGPAAALTLGGLVPAVYAVLVGLSSRTVRQYTADRAVAQEAS